MSNHLSAQASELLFRALEQGQLPIVDVQSDSMAPLLRRGDQIQLGPFASDEPVIGDIIVLGSRDDLFVHRYWGIKDTMEYAYVITRGDRLAFYDPLTRKSEMRAIVVARQRAGQLLPLKHGYGAWLNRKLTQLARLEANVLQLPFPPATSAPARPIHASYPRRFARRILLLTATLLTATAGLLSR